MSSINLFILFGIKRNLPEECNESVFVLIYKKGDKL